MTANETSFIKKIAFSFGRAFVASLIVTLPGIWASPNFQTGKAFAISAIIGAVAAGFRAIQHATIDT